MHTYKKTRITMPDEYSDIEYVGSWPGRAGKTRTKIIQTAEKMENVPIKLESLRTQCLTCQCECETLHCYEIFLVFAC